LDEDWIAVSGRIGTRTGGHFLACSISLG
jgi:hypothetical protein